MAENVSCLAEEVPPALPESKCTNVNEPLLTTNESQDDILNECLTILLDHHGVPKSRTASIMQRHTEYESKLDEANTHLIRGVREYYGYEATL